MTDNRPKMYETNWTDWVMSHLSDDECRDGNPTADGLTRILEEILGPIHEQKAEVYQVPAENNSYTMGVSYTFKIWCDKLAGQEPHYRTCTEVADVHNNNCDPKFAVFMATASSRARGRCARVILRLKKCCAEEMPSSFKIPNDDEPCSIDQQSLIRSMCNRLKINLDLYLQSGKRKFSRLEDMPYGIAQATIQLFNKYQQKTVTIPESLKLK